MDAGTKCMVCKTGNPEEGRKVCPECLGSKWKVSSASTPEVLSEIVEGTKRAMAGKKITAAAGIGGMRYQCRAHGEHNGCTFGGKPSAHCPFCLEEKRAKMKQVKRAGPDSMVLDFSGHEQLFAEIKRLAMNEIRTDGQQAIHLIAQGLRQRGNNG